MPQAPQEGDQRLTARQLLLTGALAPEQSKPSTTAALAKQGVAAALMPEQPVKQPDGAQPQRPGILAGALTPLSESEKSGTISALLQAGLGYQTKDGQPHLLATIAQVGLAPIDNAPRDAEGNPLPKPPGAAKQLGHAIRTGLGLPEMNVTPTTIAAAGAHYLARGVQAAFVENSQRELKEQELKKIRNDIEDEVRTKAQVALAKEQAKVLAPVIAQEEAMRVADETEKMLKKAQERTDAWNKKRERAQKKEEAKKARQTKRERQWESVKNSAKDKGTKASQAAKSGVKTFWSKITNR